MSGIRRGNNNNNNINNNGYHHHGLGNMPSKRELANLPFLDLHGCFKQDAKRKVTDFLEQQAAAIIANNNGGTRGLCKIITGTGSHSSATGGPILRAAVENLLLKREIHYDAKTCPGAFIVDAGTGIVLENRASTASDTKILLAHAQDEAVILQRATQQQGKKRAAQAAAASAHNGRSNSSSSLHSSNASLDNNNNFDNLNSLLSGPSLHEVTRAEKAEKDLEWAQVESRKAHDKEQQQLANADSKQVERAISLSLLRQQEEEDLSSHHHHHHYDDDDDDNDNNNNTRTWEEELEIALKMSQQEITTENVQEKIKQALQESARLEQERREMEKRELEELETALRLSQQDHHHLQQQHQQQESATLKPKELRVVDNDEDLELERALLESAKLQELEAAMRKQEQAEAEKQRRQLELETLATIERQRAVEKQIALERQQRRELEKKQQKAAAAALQRQQQELEKQAARERQKQIELEKQAALERQQELEKKQQAAAALERKQQELEKQAARERQTGIEKQGALEWQLELEKQATRVIQNSSALQIQATVRGYQCRRKTCDMKTRIKAAIVVVQTCWRRRLALVRYQRRRQAAAAATLIQSVTRSYQCRRLLLVSHEAEKEATRKRQQEEEKNEKLAMALQKEENEKAKRLTAALAFHMCAEAEAEDEDQKQLAIALSLSQQETEKQAQSSAGLEQWQDAALKRQAEVEKQATSDWQKVEQDLQIQAACIGPRYRMGNTEEDEDEKEDLKQASVQSKESLGGQLKRAPENASSQSTPGLPPRECFKTVKGEKEESIRQQGGASTAKPSPATMPKQQSSNLKPPPPSAPGPKTQAGVQVERAPPGEHGEESKRKAVDLNTVEEQSPGEATQQQQEETLGRAEQTLEDAASSSGGGGYSFKFPERRESAKSKQDTEALDQAILQASRSKDANLLADFLSRSF